MVGSDLGLRAALDDLEGTIYGDRLEGIQSWAFDEDPPELAVGPERDDEPEVVAQPEVVVQPGVKGESQVVIEPAMAEAPSAGSESEGAPEAGLEVALSASNRSLRERRRGARTAPARRGTRARRSVASDPRGQRGAGRGRKSGSSRR